jgi:hypothetical protein
MKHLLIDLRSGQLIIPPVVNHEENSYPSLMRSCRAFVALIGISSRRKAAEFGAAS